MTREKWSDLLETLTSLLQPSLSQFKHEDPIIFCLNQRLHLSQFINSFANHKIQKCSLYASKKQLEARKNVEIKDIKEFPNVQGGEKKNASWEDIKNSDKLPALRDGKNPNFPFASNCLEVHYTEDKGRHVIAKCDIKAGDVLFVERPFSHVVLKWCCSECCEDTLAPILCLNCIDVQYCSEKCRDTAWESCHKFECPFMDLLRETGIGHLAFRTLIKAASNLDDLKETVNRLKTKEQLHVTKPTVFSQNEYENVYYLQTHVADMETEDLLHYSLTATLLALYLVYHTSYGGKSDEDIKFCGTLLLRHITQLVSNAHSITSVKLTSNEGAPFIVAEEREQVASAIYQSASMMNHSCEPSIINCFHKYYLIVRACKDLEKGEEVYNSYGIDCRRMNRSRRQYLLMCQYFFHCRCVPCCEDYDRFDILNSFKCEVCKGPLVEPSKYEKEPFKSIRPLLNCLNCSHNEVLEEEKLFMKSEISKLIQHGESKLFEQNDVLQALQAFTKAWKLSRMIFYKFHKVLSYSANQIAQCLFILGDYKRCYMFLKCCTLAVEGRFGRSSIELAFEAKRLSDVIRFYCQSEARRESKELEHMRSIAMKYYEMSKETFKLLYGKDHPIVFDIQTAQYSLQTE